MRKRFYFPVGLIVGLLSIQLSAFAAEKKPARFDRSAGMDMADMNARADASRDETIAKLEKLIPTISSGPQRAELMFRLSEMYWKKANFKRLQAMGTWEKELNAYHEAGAKGKEPALETIAEFGEFKAAEKEALTLYGKILKAYPKYERNDEVLYNLGSSAYHSGNKKAGVRHYRRLIKEFPKSAYLADAWLELGEHYFGANQLPEATKAYSNAAKSKKPQIYTFATYKLAWCDFNLGHYDQSIKRFKSVVELSNSATNQAQVSKKDRLHLIDEALTDLTRAYAGKGEVDEAVEYYRTTVGAEKAYPYLQRLAKRFARASDRYHEVKTYQALNSLYPTHQDAPANHLAIMNALAADGQAEDVRKQVRILIDRYSPEGSWAQANASNPDVLERAFIIVEQQLGDLAAEQHRLAQSTKYAETYRLAGDLYREYLDKFPESKRAYNYSYYYGDILFELKQFREAAGVFDTVVASKPDGKFAKDAAYSSIISWEKVVDGVTETVGKKITQVRKGKAKGELKKLEQIKKLEEGKTYERAELTADELKLAAAYDRYAEVAPKDPQTVRIKFKSARLYYVKNQFEQAAVRFGHIIENYPSHEMARRSAEHVVESFNVRKDWSNLNKWARRFSERHSLMKDRGFAKVITEYIQGASFNEIFYVFQPNETPAQVAERYAAYEKEFPKTKFAMVALFNAIVNFDKSNQLEKAITSSERMLKVYEGFKPEGSDKAQAEGPKPEVILEKSTFMAASFYERLGRFNKAVALYDTFAEKYPKSENHADALFNSGLYHEGLREFSKAIASFQAYIKKYPNKPDVAALRWRVGKLLAKSGQHAAAAKYYTAHASAKGLSASERICSQYKATESRIAAGDKISGNVWASYSKAFDKLKGEERQAECAQKAAAHARFELLQPTYDEYMAITLSDVPQSKVVKNFEKKVQMVADLEKKYTAVLAVGHGDYGIASLYRIGVVYKHLADELGKSPCPKALNEEQCMMYQSTLFEKAMPMEEKAIAAFDSTITKAFELKIYNDWLVEAQAQMVAYEPGRFPEVRVYELVESDSSVETPTPVALTEARKNDLQAAATPAAEAGEE